MPPPGFGGVTSVANYRGGGGANALADTSIGLNEMFFSFTDTGDHTPVIITMAAYTSLCKCLLARS